MEKDTSKEKKSSWKIVKNVFFGFICVILGYVLIGNIAAQNSTVYNISHYMNVVVLTGSMEPSIKPGDYITVIKKNPNSYKVGDVVTYVHEGSKVTHQIISIDGDEVITQGTANNNADIPISKSDILGKQVITIPKLGYVMKFLSSTTGIILIVGLIIAVVFWEITEPKEDDEDEAKKLRTKTNKKKKLPKMLNKEMMDEDEVPNIAVKANSLAASITSRIPKVEPNIADVEDNNDLITELTRLREEKKKILEAQKLLDESRKKEIEEISKKLEQAYEDNKPSQVKYQVEQPQFMEQSQVYRDEDLVSKINIEKNKPKSNRTLKLIRTLAGINITSEDIVKATGIALEKVNRLRDDDKIINIAKNLLDMNMPINEVSLATGLSEDEISSRISEVKLDVNEVWEDHRVLNIAINLLNSNMSLDNISRVTGLTITRIDKLKEEHRVILITKNLYSMGMSLEDISNATALSINEVKSYISKDSFLDIDEGNENKVSNVVKNLLSMGMSMDNIIRATGLTLSEIRDIKEDIEMEAIAKNLLNMNISPKYIAEATGLSLGTIMKIKGNDNIIEIGRKLLKLKLSPEEVSSVTRLPLDVVELIEVEPIKKSDVISIDFGAL